MLDSFIQQASIEASVVALEEGAAQLLHPRKKTTMRRKSKKNVHQTSRSQLLVIDQCASPGVPQPVPEKRGAPHVQLTLAKMT
ncbi:hypothetical protein ACLOJK_026799 [Asimina triloba]